MKTFEAGKADILYNPIQESNCKYSLKTDASKLGWSTNLAQSMLVKALIWEKESLILFIYFEILQLNFEPSLKLWWCRVWDLFGLQIPMTPGGFEVSTGVADLCWDTSAQA